jgi:hypothetical protein
MLLAHKWAWEALLATNKTNDATVEQIEKDIQDASDNGKEVQPELRARVELYWLQKAITEQVLGARAISALLKLRVLVHEHDSGVSRFDDAIDEAVDALDPDVNLALRVRYVTPDFPGSVSNFW